MSAGFSVQLAALENFVTVAAKVINDYDVVGEQLKAADLKAVDPEFTTLLGVSIYDGSTDVNNACRQVLVEYRNLYNDILWAHTVFRDKLEEIVKAFNATQQLYADVDAEQGVRLNSLLEGLQGFSAGGRNGAA